MLRAMPIAATCLLAAACGGTQTARGEAPAPAAAPDRSSADAPQRDLFDCEGLFVFVTAAAAEARVTRPGGRTLLLPHMAAASGAQYGNGAEAFWNKGAEATLTMDGRTAECRLRRDPWHEARTRGIDVRAAGQEPGWFLEIDEGASVRLVYAYGAAEVTARAPSPVTEARRTTYTASVAAALPGSYSQTLVVTLDERPCQDGMSGQPFSHTVTVALDKTVLSGCGRWLGPRRDRWTVSAMSAGPVRIGSSRDQAAAALGDALAGAPARGSGCAYLRSRAAPDAMLFMLVDGRIVRVDVTSPGVATPEGIEVGSSETHVYEAYGPRVTPAPHKYVKGGRSLTVGSDAGQIVFDTDGQWVTRYRAGQASYVEWVEGCS